MENKEEKKTVLVVSTVTHNLRIPKRKAYSNDKDEVFKFEAGKPLEVPADIGETFARSMPYKYKIVNSKKPVPIPEGEKGSDGPEGAGPDAFDPQRFLEVNEPVTVEAVIELNKEQLFQLAAHVGASIKPNSKTDAIARAIVKTINPDSLKENAE